MPASPNYYPALSRLVNLETLGGNLGLFQDVLDGLFDNLYYKDLQLEKSREGDYAHYRLKLILYQTAGVPLSGTGGMRLLINPDSTGTAVIIPLAVGYRWEILRYIRNFAMPLFQGNVRGFFDMLLELVKPDLHELLTETIHGFISDANPVQYFVDAYNTANPGNTISPASDPDEAVFIQNVLDAFDVAGVDVLEVIYSDYVNADPDPAGGTSPDELESIGMSRLQSLFHKWMGYFDWDDFKQSLIPEGFALIENITVALDFPPHILKQWDSANGEYVLNDGEIMGGRLSVNVGSLQFHTKSGFTFNNLLSVSFTESEILSTGLTIGFTEAKLDLSRQTNIPEADAAGYPTDFVGVYIQEASIGLPAFWVDNSTTGFGIIGKDLLIGTGGFSGTICLHDSAGVLDTTLGNNGFNIGLTDFDITFRQNAIVESNIRGQIPAKQIPIIFL